MCLPTRWKAVRFPNSVKNLRTQQTPRNATSHSGSQSFPQASQAFATRTQYGQGNLTYRTPPVGVQIPLGRAGEPPGHTPQRFCRGSSPEFLERPGQDLLRTPSVLIRHTTQLTPTPRNNATLTKSRQRNSLDRTMQSAERNARFGGTQLQRHWNFLYALTRTADRHPAVFRERRENSRHIQATRRRDFDFAVIFA